MCNCSAHSNQFFSSFSLKSVCSVNETRAIQLAKEVKATLGGPKGHLTVGRLEHGLTSATNEVRCLLNREDGNGELKAVKAFIMELGKYPRINIQDENARTQFSELITTLKSTAQLYARSSKAAAQVATDTAPTETSAKKRARNRAKPQEATI